MALQP